MLIRSPLVVIILASLSSLVSAQPPYVVSVDEQPQSGSIFIANIAIPSAIPITSDLVELDAHGNIIHDKPCYPAGWHILDFQPQPTGVLTYGAGPQIAPGGVIGGKFYVLDSSSWNVIDSMTASAPFQTDVHELRMFRDGHYALLGLGDTLIARKDLYPGSTDTARIHINDNVVEIFDASKRSIFQWRGIDHYRVQDARIINKRTVDSGDFQHANAIDFDANGNILLSNRHLCEVTLIEYPSGRILWRLGGKHNQFTLLGDSVWFSFQHSARFLPNGHLLLYDNGNIDTVEGSVGTARVVSRAMEYELDTVAKTAKAVWEYRHTPDIKSSATGYVERMPNGNTMIAWGFIAPDSIAVTEVRPNKSIAFELQLKQSPAIDACYRAVKLVPQELGVGQAEQPADAATMERLSNDRFLVKLPDAGEMVMTVFDALGRRIMESRGSSDLTVDATGWPRGLYFCEIKAANWHTSIPFVY